MKTAHDKGLDLHAPPPVTVRFPREFPLERISELAQSLGYKIRWVPPDINSLRVRRVEK